MLLTTAMMRPRMRAVRAVFEARGSIRRAACLLSGIDHQLQTRSHFNTTLASSTTNNTTMLANALTLGLVGFAAAAPFAATTPFTRRQVIPNYPEKSLSQGFKLVANVTDLSQDLSPSVNYFEVAGYHTGAAMNAAVLTESNGRVFYANGTIEEWRYARSNVISDSGGVQPFPEGLQMTLEEGQENLYAGTLNVGAGTAGIVSSRFPEPYSFMLPGSFAICPEHVGGVPEAKQLVLKRVDGLVVPADCAPVNLVPQCAELPELPEGAISSHEFVLDTACYPDVSELPWSVYGP